jgi:hypothetical protein
MKKINRSRIGFVFGTVLLGALTGCIGYDDRPRQAVVYAPPPPVYVEPAPVMQDDYVYYPGYEVYYSSRRHQYTYREGRSWVSRPAPPRVSAAVLSRSPSVRLDFHDSPAGHHATVVQQYPKHWSPPKSNARQGEGNRDDRKGDDRGGRR